MISSKFNIRVTYRHTDKMGFCYYGNYPEFYEIGRTELIRGLGLSYKDIEDIGILMPVINMNIEYVDAALYDDVLTIKTFIKEIPHVKIHFYYEIYNQHDKLINRAETTLVFIDNKTKRPVRAILERLKHCNPSVYDRIKFKSTFRT